MLEVEEGEEKRKKEELEQKAVMDDLIHNSEMLPDLMLATSKLEMEIG